MRRCQQQRYLKAMRCVPLKTHGVRCANMLSVLLRNGNSSQGFGSLHEPKWLRWRLRANVALSEVAVLSDNFVAHSACRIHANSVLEPQRQHTIKAQRVLLLHAWKRMAMQVRHPIPYRSSCSVSCFANYWPLVWHRGCVLGLDHACMFD